MLISPTTGLPLASLGVEKIGNPNPDFTMGITNTTYKNFSLYFLLTFVKVVTNIQKYSWRTKKWCGFRDSWIS
jgi:hypothetical protein